MNNQINNQSLIPSADVIQLTLTLKMTTAQVVETSVNVNNSPFQHYVNPDDHGHPTYRAILKKKGGKKNKLPRFLHRVRLKLEPSRAILYQPLQISENSQA